MNPMPWLLRAFGRWDSIKAQVNAWASSNGYPTYTESPTSYRFEGWGTEGFPPVVRCNVKLLTESSVIDAGRFPR